MNTVFPPNILSMVGDMRKEAVTRVAAITRNVMPPLVNITDALLRFIFPPSVFFSSLPPLASVMLSFCCYMAELYCWIFHYLHPEYSHSNQCLQPSPGFLFPHHL